MNDKLVNRPTEGVPQIEPGTPSLPDKLQGKSVEEVADMYVNLEKRIGQQSLELGQLRRLQEATAIQSQPQAPPEPTPDNLQPYINYQVNEALKPIAGTLLEQKQEQFEVKLAKSHPDWKDLAGTDDFADWVSASPIRLQIFQQADTGMDVGAASELLTMFKATNGLEDGANEAVSHAVKREQKIRAAGSERGGTVTPKSGKTIRRADVIALKSTNPDEYQRRLPEIRQAYAEGRVI